MERGLRRSGERIHRFLGYEFLRAGDTVPHFPSQERSSEARSLFNIAPKSGGTRCGMIIIMFVFGFFFLIHECGKSGVIACRRTSGSISISAGGGISQPL